MLGSLSPWSLIEDLLYPDAQLATSCKMSDFLLEFFVKSLCVCHVENVLVMHEVDCTLDVILNLLCHHHILIIAHRLISVTGVTLLHLAMSIWLRSTLFRI